MNNNLLSVPQYLPDIVITTELGSKKYSYDNLILNSFCQRVCKGDLWNSRGDAYTISFSSIPSQLLQQLEHGGYNISEIKFIFTHQNLDDKNYCEVERVIILTNPSIESILNINSDSHAIYKWNIYNTWTNCYNKRD